MNTELLLRVQQIDPAPPDDSIPDGVWDAQQVLEQLQRRTGDSVPQRSRTYRRWLIAAAVAVVVLVLIGGLGVLTGDQSTDAPPVITQPGPTPTTVPESPTTTLAGAPVVPLGEGPEIEFVQVESPVEGALGNGTWFNGNLYVLSSSDGTQDARELFRTNDGFTWELVPGLPGATSVRHSMLQTDGNLLVNVVMPADGSRGIRSDAFIQVNTSTNGTDWISSRITLPVPIGSNLAGEFQFGESFWFSDNFAVGPKGIVVTATIDLVFGGEGFANSSSLIDAMNADPTWKPQVDGFLAQLTSEMSPMGRASASVGYAWFSPDGTTWETVSRDGPLDGGEFSSVLGTSDGFVATATNPYRTDELPPDMQYLADGFDSTIVWESDDGTTWTKASGLISRHGAQPSKLVEWRGAIVEHVGVGTVFSASDDTEVWTLTSPPESVFRDVPTDGMLLSITNFGLFGSPSYGWWGPDATELLFSTDGTAWKRWEPTQFEIGGPRDEGVEHSGDAWVVGTGDDFVVMQRRVPDATSGDSLSLWVGQVQDQ